MELCIILNRIGRAAFPLQWQRAGAIALLIGVLGLTGCTEPGENGAAAQTETATAAPTISRDRIEASLDAAEDYLRGGKLREAEAILIRLIDRAPNEIDAHELYAQVLLNRAGEAHESGHEARARELFAAAYDRYKTMTDLMPRSAELHLVAGEVAQTAGMIDQALLHYRRAEELDAANPRYAIFAAQILMDRGALDDASDMLDRALSLDEDEPLVHATLASLAAEREAWDEAIEHVRVAREISPRDLSFRVLEASLHRRRGNPEAGVQLLRHLNDEQKARPYVATELAYGYRAMGEHEHAARAWQRKYEANPTAADAWQSALKVAESMIEVGRRDHATLWLREARVAGASEAAIRDVESKLSDTVEREPAR